MSGLNQNINSEQQLKKSMQELQKNQYNDPIRQIQSRFLNFANATKWIFYIPIGYIFRHTTKYGQNLQVPINCRSVQFPSFKIGSTKTAFYGHSFDLSTRQNLTQKGLTIKYLVNQNWFQYMMLLKWFQLEDFTYYTRQSNNGIDNQKQYNKFGNPSNVQKIKVDNSGFRRDYDLGLDLYGSTQGPIVPCYLYLLDNYNNRVCSIYFQDCWLAQISNIDLSYAKTSGTQIQGSFQLKFAKYSLKFQSQYLIKMFKDTGISKETL